MRNIAAKYAKIAKIQGLLYHFELILSEDNIYYNSLINKNNFRNLVTKFLKQIFNKFYIRQYLKKTTHKIAFNIYIIAKQLSSLFQILIT